MDIKPKKIVIIHASAGDGHRKAALALEQAARLRLPDASIEVVDALDCFPAWLKAGYPGLYLFMIHKAPFLWGWCYNMSDAPLTAFFTVTIRRWFNSIFTRRLEKHIEECGADLLISTHFLGSEVAAHLKRRKRFHAEFVTVITDFMVHRFWVFKETDTYAVAVERTKEELVKAGADPKRIRVTGIPVDPKFARVSNRIMLATKLGIASDRFTILLTSGGSGAGPLRQVLEAFTEKDKVQMLVICGRNAALHAELSARYGSDPRIRLFKFVDNMDELMDCSDVVVGKAGGLTLSESLAKRKPFCIVSPVPGQETRNAACLSQHGAAFWIRRPEELVERIRSLMNEPQERLFAAIDEVRRPRSAEDVIRIAEEFFDGRA